MEIVPDTDEPIVTLWALVSGLVPVDWQVGKPFSVATHSMRAVSPPLEAALAVEEIVSCPEQFAVPLLRVARLVGAEGLYPAPADVMVKAPPEMEFVPVRAIVPVAVPPLKATLHVSPVVPVTIPPLT